MKFFTHLFIICTLIACQPKANKKTENKAVIKPEFAKGFTYEKYAKYIKVIVKTPYKGATTPYEYIIVKGDTVIKPSNENQIIINTPLKKIIATSTTQIPVLEALKSETLLKGYPNTKFISSKKTRTLIDNGSIVDIGHEEHMNTEMVLDIQPDILFAFAVNNINKNFTTLKKAGIPIVIDASWLEETPLGRAEWIKFFALFLNKEKEANLVFDEIVKNYHTALKTIPDNIHKPNVLYGGIYNDIWYTPAGDSYVAQIMKDAGTNYYWQNTESTGSLALQFEEVFVEAKNADFWFAPGYALDKKALANNNKHYSSFKPFSTNNIYTYTNTVGETGGLVFFELGALRPDLILKDFIKICHPELLPDYETTFFKRLE
ncbi:ABC transporter substrate-binding protein [Wenyingzhuangia marina]|uniref:Iron complex transport system substrate-binding protein n=1 Tax=Wenyingzhuangia marina TaxID=1195760 RepID=A0A1M5WQ95_9FLAO|nr:ABC transporter substrate-binding protein [Wenyingzhuangia marina]GGF79715.1 ABC transporter substrate-binding protein [Wenyingzhuangia marina]SHH89314.1 iron complex transport system substrate-binding protein [Wenyingzhuangia marina]